MKSKKQVLFEQNWSEITKLKMFEIEVINKQTNDRDWIIFDIELHGQTFYAYHVALNSKQDKSKKVAFVKHVCDVDFSIDSNLEVLFDSCICAILNSEYYNLID
jgi:hypothetical protein